MKIFMIMFIILMICSTPAIKSNKIQPPYYQLVSELTTPMTTEINSRINLPSVMYYHREFLKRSEKENFFLFKDWTLSSNNLQAALIKLPMQMAMLEVEFNLQNVALQPQASDRIVFNLYLGQVKIASQAYRLEYAIIKGITLKGQAFNVPAGPHKISLKIDAPSTDGTIAFYCSSSPLQTTDIRTRCNSNNVDIIKGYVEVVGTPLKP